MMSRFVDVSNDLRTSPRTWLVTGAAGFIGSHLVEKLLALGQRVVGVDNFATGSRRNVDAVGTGRPGFTFLEGDINDAALMARACAGADVVLHQAALGSVPRSLKDPLATHRANVDGFVVTLLAARDAGVKRVVYASSSSVYGDDPNLPKVEDRVGHPLSPYAATKAIDEVYADVFGRSFGLSCIGLRYFNVFGPRQDPNGPYAAVIPVWVASMLRGEPCRINGDGETSRDFCYVDNAVQANILAGVANADAAGRAYNVACGARTTLTTLHDLIRDGLADRAPDAAHRRALLARQPIYGPFRDGDVRHSLADINLARRLLGYEPTHDVAAGLDAALGWYVAHA
jgi:UDP-N-acetylglucosamine/UDP-N-acetylgalactosamine 4-epimerase